MSIYSDISKQIGWQARSVEWPSVEAATELHNKVKSGDVDAFRTVFNIYRHAISDYTKQEEMTIICDAYTIGCHNKDWK